MNRQVKIKFEKFTKRDLLAVLRAYSIVIDAGAPEIVVGELGLIIAHMQDAGLSVDNMDALRAVRLKKVPL